MLSSRRQGAIESQRKPQILEVQAEADDELRQSLNDALAQVATLENQLAKIKQDGRRTTTRNQYLDDTNARLRRQLLELKADEQELAQRNKELTATNRRLSNAQKSFDSQEKSNYNKIRDLELGKSTIQRRANNILAENNTLSAENKKLKAFGDKLQRENDALQQKVAGINIDLGSAEARLSDTEALLKSKDAQVDSLENNEIKLEEDINGLRNEVARLAGVEDLLKDRNSNLLDESEMAKDRYRQIEVENEALLAEVEALRNYPTNLNSNLREKGANCQLASPQQ